MCNNYEGHSHGTQNLEAINRAFYIGIFLNAFYTAIEFIVGYANNSLALIADASHNLSDVASLIISLIGMKLAQKAATLAFTYGYKKASILASMINAVLLIVIVIGILREAIERLSSPAEVGGKVIIITALIGVAVNAISAFLFYKGQKSDINIKGAFIHLLVDALVSVGVVISGVIIYYTGLNIIDPIISMVIAIVILLPTWGLLKESLKLILDGIPKNVKIDLVKEAIQNIPEVENMHHVHVWGLSSNINALTAHVVLVKEYSLQDQMVIKDRIKHELEHQNVHHATIEFDKNISDCQNVDCD